MKLKTLVLTSFILLFNTGCASMFTGTSSNINITSTPSGADCDLAGHGVHTPGNILIPKSSSNLTVNCQKQGYEAGSTPVQSTFNSTTLLNILTVYFLVIGTVVDFATGAAWEYPSNVNVNLVPEVKS